MNSLRFVLAIAAALLFLAPARADDANPAALKAKLKSLIVSVNFNNASISEVAKSLTALSKQVDPDHKGMEFAVAPDATGPGKAISINLQNVPLSELLNFVCQMSGLHYRVDAHGVTFLSATSDAA
jgi:type II secretory pathway component GspD/PulD (secretin)